MALPEGGGNWKRDRDSRRAPASKDPEKCSMETEWSNSQKSRDSQKEPHSSKTSKNSNLIKSFSPVNNKFRKAISYTTYGLPESSLIDDNQVPKHIIKQAWKQQSQMNAQLFDIMESVRQLESYTHINGFIVKADSLKEVPSQCFCSL